ncbi:MAG: hypothetical protein ACRDGI_02195 [Candidatus Limnocylindrales bacterium]
MRITLTFAALWHLLWAAFLLPYAVVIAMALGGQASAQDLVEGLALRFGLAIASVAGGFVLNVGLAAVISGPLAGVSSVVQVLVAAGVFGVIWFFAVQDLLPYLDLGSGASISPAAPWAALAGAAYGVVLAMGLDAGQAGAGDLGPAID